MTRPQKEASTTCTDQIPKVIQAAKERMLIREKLRPLFDTAGWFDKITHAATQINTRSRVAVGVFVKENGGFEIVVSPGDVKCEVESITKAIEFTGKLRKAIEEADL